MQQNTKEIVKKIRELSELRGKIIKKDNEYYKVLFVTSKSQELVYKCLSITTGENVLISPHDVVAVS